MKRSIIFGLVLAALLLNLALGAYIYLRAAKTTNDNDSAQASEELFEDALQKIHSEYVDGKDLTYRQLVYSALKGAVSRLDPHSEFLDADSYQELQDDTEGQFGGVDRGGAQGSRRSSRSGLGRLAQASRQGIARRVVRHHDRGAVRSADRGGLMRPVKTRPRWRCDFCRYSSSSVTGMEVHERRCWKNPNRICDLCGNRSEEHTSEL